MIHMRYDRQVDALSIDLRPGSRSARTVRVTDTVRVDFDAQDRLISIEVLDATDHVDRQELEQLQTPAVKYTLAEASKKSGLSSSTLRGQLNKGRIRGEKQGRDWIVDAMSLENYLESREARGRPPASAKARRRRKATAKT